MKLDEKEMMIPKWKFWIWPTLLSSPWLVFLVLHTINPPPPSEDWRLLLVFLTLGIYAVFLVPYWLFVSIRNRLWGFLIPLVIVNLVWLGRAVFMFQQEEGAKHLSAWFTYSTPILATFMLASTVAVAIVYTITTSLTKR